MKSLIDYVICENFSSSQTLDSVLKSDHSATLTSIGETVKKILFDKTKYSKNAFSLDVGKINWRSFCLSENPEVVYKNFCSSLGTELKSMLNKRPSLYAMTNATSTMDIKKYSKKSLQRHQIITPKMF